jgi:hypothetical protein
MAGLLDGKIRVEIAPFSDPADPTTWDWVDITAWDGISRIRYAQGIDHAWGVRNEGGYCDPSTCSLTIDNRDGAFSSRNRMGPWYGGLTKNTPMQITVGDQDTLPAASVRSVSTHESGSTGAFNVSAPAGVQAGDLMVAFHTNDFGFLSQMGVPTGGSQWEPLGEVTLPNFCNTKVWWKVAGSEPGTYGFTQADNADAVVAIVAVEDAAGTVPTIDVLSSSTVSDLVATPSTDPGPARLELRWAGANSVDTSETTFTAPAGFSELADLDSQSFIAGSLAERDLTSAEPTGVHEFEASQDILYHNGVTVNISNAPAALPVTFVPEWPVDWNPLGTRDSYVRISAKGTLHRIQQGAKPFHSATRRVAESNPAVAAYWPMEDGSGATRLESPITGVRAIQPARDWSPAAIDGPGGSKPLPVLRPTASFFAQVPNTMAANATWLAEWLFYMEAGVASSRTMLRTISSTGITFLARINTTNFNLLIQDGDGTQISSDSQAVHADFFDRWVFLRLTVTADSASTAHASLGAWTVDGDALNAVISSTASFAAGRPTKAGFDPLAATPDTRSIGHLAFGPRDGEAVGPLILTGVAGPSLGHPPLLVSLNGWAGEFAASRFSRLCVESGIPAVVRGNPPESQPMGSQLPKTLPELLREIEDTDGGRVHEIGTGLGYLTRAARQNLPVAMHIGADQLARTPRPTDDDLQLVNQVEVSREGGSSAVARSEASIVTDGLADRSHPVNTHTDNPLEDIGGWLIHRGTHDGYRWPLIPIELHRPSAEALIPTWQSLRIGDRITADHAFTQLPNVDIDVQLEGWRQHITQVTWNVFLYSVPDSPWQLGTLGSGRYSPRFGDAVLDAGINSSTTTMVVDIGDSPWVTSAAEPDLFPMQIETFPAALGGRFGTEVMTVTAIGSVSGGNQTFTVTRGANGIAVAHAAGTAVMLVDPLRYSL